MSDEKRVEIIVIERGDRCRCYLHGPWQYRTPEEAQRPYEYAKAICPHDSVVRPLTAADIPADIAVEALEVATDFKLLLLAFDNGNGEPTLQTVRTPVGNWRASCSDEEHEAIERTAGQAISKALERENARLVREAQEKRGFHEQDE